MSNNETVEIESPPIRPIWIIGASAGLVILGICAIVSVCAAIPIIWFTVQTSTNATRATESAWVRQTERAPTPANTVTATPLTLLTTQQPTPIVFSTSTQITLRPAPDEAVKTYYQLVSQGRYDLTWSLLTDAFKQKFNCCAPNYNYTDYVGWWDSVNYVDFGDVHTVSQTGDQALVYAEIYYIMNTGDRSSVVNDPYIQLVYDAASSSWRFEDKRSFP